MKILLINTYLWIFFHSSESELHKFIILHHHFYQNENDFLKMKKYDICVEL